VRAPAPFLPPRSGADASLDISNLVAPVAFSFFFLKYCLFAFIHYCFCVIFCVYYLGIDSFNFSRRAGATLERRARGRPIRASWQSLAAMDVLGAAAAAS
jgi:hypothetical protein